jgi:hypothetical protein
VLLSRGDITKRERILWGYTLEECKPYAEYIQRDVLFREAVIAFLGGGKKQSAEDEYCETCRAAKKDDCKNCNRQIEVIERRA